MLACYKQIRDESIKTHFNNYDPTKYNNVASVIFQYVEEAELSIIAAMTNLIKNIENLYLKKTFGFEEFYTIIQSIDSRCSYNEKKMFQKEVNVYEGINISKDYGLSIFPILKNTALGVFNESLIQYEKSAGKRQKGLRKREKLNNDRINDYLDNYAIVKDEPYKIILYTLNECFNFFKNSNDINTFSVNVIPVLNFSTEKIFKFRENTIDIETVNDEYKSQVVEIYKSILKKNNQNDLIIFPELFLTGMDLNEIYDLIKNTTYDYSKIFVLGSRSEQGSNKCIVVTSNGTVLFEQHKKTPYTKEGKFENLENSDQIINIIDILPVGRIGIVICKDILNSDIKNYFKILNVDIIIVVSYSPSLNMKSASEELAKANWCITIMCNSCSAINEEQNYNKRIGYITLPAKKDTYSDYYTEFYTNERCNKCKDCEGHSINIIYNEVRLYNDKLSIKIEKAIENQKNL